MQALSSKVAAHYHKPNLYEVIVEQLQLMDVDLQKAQRSDIAAVDEFHVRGAEVSKELAETVHISNTKVLDVGCGIGGPCRMLADEFNCEVTGVDLSEEFIRTAAKLSKLVGLEEQTTFIQGDATNIPIVSNQFDVVWTQHVQMNIGDKTKFYSEIKRVLKEGGTFLYYDIFKKGNESVNYPMPWAGESKISFLAPIIEMEAILEGLGFKKIKSTDQTAAGIAFFEKMIVKMLVSGPPKLGLNVLMGNTTKIKIGNLLEALKQGKLELQSGIYSI